MFLLYLTKNKDNIQVYNHKLSNKILDNFIHEPHNGVACICKPKWKYQPLIQTIICFKSGLSFISFSNYDLMIATL